LVVLYILIGIAAASALGVLVARTVLNAALSLMACLLAIACIYIVLSAEFLAIVQILVYAGGILLLIIFGIMVTGRDQDVRPASHVPTIVMGLTLTSLFWWSLINWRHGELSLTDRTVQTIGIELMTTYAAPFEFSGLLILVSMIGAMIVASFKKQVK
jgi:NADH:ubiquinone oxidoreductase subunit 6 (subunit J)